LKKYLKTGVFIFMIVSIFLLSTSIVSAQDLADLNLISDSDTNNMEPVDLNITSDSNTANELDPTDLNSNENAQTSQNTYTFSDLQNQIDK